MKAIIFGISGQDGKYLKDILEKENVSVIGVSRSKGNWMQGSVSDRQCVQTLIKDHTPDYIFHLAANSTTNHQALFENHETISTGTLNILESVKLFSPKTKVFISGSGLQFANKGQPISEESVFEARDAYSVSRIQSVYAARYFRSLGIKTCVGYFFNHDSPLRTERHVNQKIVLAAKRIANGSGEKLELGDITVKKEFTFAGDVASAIWLLVRSEEVSEAVIGSGKAFSIEDWLEICFSHFKLNWKEHTIIKRNFEPDYKILVSDPKKLFKLGWKQTVSIKELAELMIDHIGK